MNQNARDALNASIDDYAASLSGKSVREILNSDYQPPDIASSGLDMNNPNVLDAVNFWKTTKRDWRQRYGSLSGYDEFNNYWAVTANSASASQAFNGKRWQQIRDNFGYASPTQIYNTNLDNLATGNYNH